MAGQVGFIGIGIMGLPMAKNLVTKAGKKLVVWNRSQERIALLQGELADEAAQVEAAESPEAVVKACDVTFVMLTTPSVVRSVLFDMPGAAIHGVSSGKMIIDCSTITEEDSRASYDAVKTAGGSFLEAPVSGSKVPAETGALIFLAGGDKDVFDEVVKQKMFDVMGKKSIFLGGIGAGARMKLAVNMVMGSMISALAEGIVLCESNELDPAEFLEVLDLGAMANPMFKMKGPNMVQSKRQYTVNFPLEHQQKDMRFALQMGDSSATPMPVAAAANELFKAARAAGYDREDMSAVIEALRKRNE
ncbi:Glyoxylate/succinic semialdehyde reductase 1 [Porphyridium purpureum]|uniref:Glyoxylate/succinic semialdehyde reductase 1 n=1 Tax=Porphyridium purpureum TaxID=35688 RepID=A0A5J4YL83_PORPP|nr:Glyoxylate/succinic semialdehyde reductase 1 [Porphyridium purpureum]|eukprot:POR7892..scf244_11